MGQVYLWGMDLRTDHGEAAAAFYDKRRKWLDFTCEMGALSDRAFRVGHWLAKRMNANDKCCWYTQEQIAKLMGKSQAYVIRATAELESEGVLVIVKEHRKPNRYFIRLPFDFG